jgi:hypothetical protein
MSAIGFRTSVEKKTDETGDRVVITLDGKVASAHFPDEPLIFIVLALFLNRSVGYVSFKVIVSHLICTG